MPTPQELESAAKAIEDAWRLLERGEKLKKSAKDYLGPRVVDGIRYLETGARNMRTKQGRSE